MYFNNWNKNVYLKILSCSLIKKKQVSLSSNATNIRNPRNATDERSRDGTRFPAFVVPIVAFLSRFREDAIINYSR